MADKYDKNGYNSSDFKRNSSNQDMQADDPMAGQDGEDTKLNEKAGEYMRELLAEKIKLNNSKFPISCKLIDEEVSKVQATGKILHNSKYLDVYREKRVKVSVKVLVPVKEHPSFNFVGKLLGPKGNTMKQLQEETMCKMAVLGRGSMRDRQKEEELRNSLDPRYAHLSDELHVEVSALAPPAEAHARIAYALAEVKKYLIPDGNDMMRHNPMRDMMERDPYSGGPPRAGPPPPRGGPPPARGGGRMPQAPPMGRPMPAKTKVISILDRARSAMESSYPYDDPYAQEPPGYSGGGRGGGGNARGAPEPDFYYDRNERYYEDEPYYKEPAREFKASARDVGTRRAPPAQRGPPHYGGHARASPYARPPK